MPRSKDYMYIPVPVRKDSRLHRHLLEEAARAAGMESDAQKQIPVGPYISDLLDDRDRAIYDQGESELWFSTSSRHIASLIEATVEKVLSSLPGGVPAGSWQVSVKPAKMVEQDSEEDIEAQARAMASSWGDDDDE